MTERSFFWWAVPFSCFILFNNILDSYIFQSRLKWQIPCRILYCSLLFYIDSYRTAFWLLWSLSAVSHQKITSYLSPHCQFWWMVWRKLDCRIHMSRTCFSRGTHTQVQSLEISLASCLPLHHACYLMPTMMVNATRLCDRNKLAGPADNRHVRRKNSRVQ